MAGAQPPEAWIGRQVVANVLNAAGHDEHGFPSSLTAEYRVGILEGVNQFGILASLWYDRRMKKRSLPSAPSTPGAQ